jgi:hypothetical protein
MQSTIQAARNQAQEEFLRRGLVIGVGITGAHEDELIFLLRENSQATKNEILTWAKNLHIHVNFILADPRAL